MTVDYIGKSQCNVIKGIFILIVFFSHFQQYVAEAGGRVFNLYLGQLMVAMFLFYSGYGVAESFAVKGTSYVRDFPKRRILTTLLNFDIAVVAFIALDLVIGRSIGLWQSLLAFVCWESVGNSNWYIFVIIYCYATAWLFLGVLKLREWGGVCLFVALAISVLGLSYIRPGWWYDTMLVFAAGVLFSQHRRSAEELAERHFWKLFLLLTVLFMVFSHCGFSVRGFVYNIQAILFALMIVLVSMKLAIRNRPLEWCGERLFPIYIYQRIPMLIFFTIDPVGFASGRVWVYFSLCFGVTLLIAKWYHVWQFKWWR